MKYALLLLLTLPHYLFSQPNRKLNADLNLRSDLIFGKKITVDTDALFIDGYLLLVNISGNNLFDHIGIIHNNLGQLTSYSYSSANNHQKIEKEKRILSSLNENYMFLKDEQTDSLTTTSIFRKGDNFASYTSKSIGYELNVWTDSLITTKQEIDSDKNIIIFADGLIENNYEYTLSGKERNYELRFEGFKSNDLIKIVLYETPKKFKELKLNLDGSVSLALKASKRKKIGINMYYTEFLMNKETALKLYKSDIIKISSLNEINSQIELSSRHIKMFRIIYEKLYF